MAEAFQCGLILLAAGASQRMGQPKQLLPIDGRPLLRHVTESALRAPVAPVVVVLGAHADEIRPVLAGLSVHLMENPAWNEGLGSSVRIGVESALKLAPDVAGLIILPADQPDLPAQHLESLIERFRQGNCSLVASLTAGRRVPPVLFGAAWFDWLRQLTGDAGARDLLREDRPDFASVPLASNADLDTPEDYNRFISGGAGA
jgi:molybdenum cofactor cytidylyltransferase